MMPENTIPPPVNPLTKMINLQVLRFVAARFMEQWLPEYAQVVTSDIRTAEQNHKAGGAENSAHLHGLAEDFQLKYRQGGAAVNQAQARALYDRVIAPHWAGFTEFETASGGEGYHIHWNLSREISTYSGLAALAGIGVVGFKLLNQFNNGRAGA